MSGSGKTIADIIQERRGKKTAECFQIVDRGSRPLMLTVERVERPNLILSYQHFYMAQITPQRTQIDADFREKVLLIQGRELLPIFEGLSDHRITYLRELPRGFPSAAVPAIHQIRLSNESS